MTCPACLSPLPVQPLDLPCLCRPETWAERVRRALAATEGMVGR